MIRGADTGFNGLFGEGLATEQPSMIHVRRKFVDIFERTGSTIAHTGRIRSFSRGTYVGRGKLPIRLLLIAPSIMSSAPLM